MNIIEATKKALVGERITCEDLGGDWLTADQAQNEDTDEEVLFYSSMRRETHFFSTEQILAEWRVYEALVDFGEAMRLAAKGKRVQAVCWDGTWREGGWLVYDLGFVEDEGLEDEGSEDNGLKYLRLYNKGGSHIGGRAMVVEEILCKWRVLTPLEKRLENKAEK